MLSPMDLPFLLPACLLPFNIVSHVLPPLLSSPLLPPSQQQPITDSILFRMLSPMDLPFLLPPPPGKQRGKPKPAKVVPREICLASPAIRHASADGCYLPVDQATQYMRATAIAARVPLVFLATNARPNEIAAIAATLLGAPQQQPQAVGATAALAVEQGQAAPESRHQPKEHLTRRGHIGELLCTIGHQSQVHPTSRSHTREAV
ncbi:unnamed protein product [Closterium sp. Naga37s-1]|nr:unnamed protein product [Closterium sp. Naga37s-1]